VKRGWPSRKGAWADRLRGRLAPELLARDLVDEVRRMTYPVVVGAGRRLFGETAAVRPRRLVDTRPSAAASPSSSTEPSDRKHVFTTLCQSISSLTMIRRD